MIRFPIPIVALALVVGFLSGSAVENQLHREAALRSRPDRSAPLSVRFIPDTASKADSFACVPDPSASLNEPGMLCMSLDDFHKLEAEALRKEAPAPTQGEL